MKYLCLFVILLALPSTYSYAGDPPSNNPSTIVDVIGDEAHDLNLSSVEAALDYSALLSPTESDGVEKVVNNCLSIAGAVFKACIEWWPGGFPDVDYEGGPEAFLSSVEEFESAVLSCVGDADDALAQCKGK